MASPRSIQVEANSSTLPEETCTGEARDTSVCSPNAESAVALLHSGSGVTPTAGEGRTFSDSDWNMLVKECSSLAAKWRVVSTYLGLPKGMVDQIEADHSKSVERCWSEAISKWLQQNAPRDVYGLPSWSTLLKAIVMVDPRLARELATKHQCSLEEPTSQSPQVMDENDPAMTEKALVEIKSKFAALVIKVRKALEIKVNMKDIEVKDVRQFLVDLFTGECTIPKGADLCEIFESVSLAKLWRYDHYSPLKKLAEFCLPKEHPAVCHTTEYISRYAGFCATTSIFSFVKLSELLESDLPEDNQPLSPKKDNRYYRQLTLKLKMKKTISELTLKYVNELWESLQEEFDLPPLTAVIDKIVEGSLEITWLVLQNVVEKIRTMFYKSLNFLQQHNIISIDLYGGELILYDEAWFEGSTHLFRACFTGNLEEVKRSLDGGANVNEQNNNDFGESPLIGACRTGDMDTVTLLLEYSPDVDFQDKYGETAVITTSNYGHTKVIKVLLEYSASVNKQNKYGTTALMIACQYGDADMVKTLLKHGATIDQCDENGVTALMNASQFGNIENVEILLQCGAVVDLTNKTGGTALMCASHRGQTDCARALLLAKAQVNLKDNHGETALWDACDNNHSQTAQLLIEFGADVNLPFDVEDGGTVLSLVCRKGHTHLAITLLSHGAIVDHQDNKGQSPLHLAVASGQIETVSILLKSSARVNLQNEEGWTALFVAAQQGHFDIAKQLVEHGADPNIPSKTGLTALDVARSESHHTVCQLLEAHGAKVNTQLTEEQRKEVKSIGEKIWKQFKRMFLRELVKKEEEAGISPHAIGQSKGRRSLGGRFLPKPLRNLFKV